VTSAALAVAGWAAAAAALVAVALARRKLAVHVEAVAEACHELRGPLTAVTLGVELGGRQGALPPARVRAIELELGRAALALNDLEDTSGKVSEVPAERVDVGELLRDSVEAWRPSAAARGIELRTRWSGPDGVVRGDRLRLAQATGNLIANAIEHGGGGVEVRGRLGPEGVRIEVLDGGPGLSAPVAELIRGPYSTRPRRRGRRSDSRRGSETRRGRGLRIAHEVATAHGGRLAAAPSERGAKLVLELPAGQREGSAQAEPR
jgi:signal transduction histidine kinase